MGVAARGVVGLVIALAAVLIIAATLLTGVAALPIVLTIAAVAGLVYVVARLVRRMYD